MSDWKNECRKEIWKDGWQRKTERMNAGKDDRMKGNENRKQVVLKKEDRKNELRCWKEYEVTGDSKEWWED